MEGFELNRCGGNWVSGRLGGYRFEAKVFAEPSEFGIPTPRFEGGGNISKLHVSRDGLDVFCYDRGEDVGVTPDDAEAVGEIVAALEAALAW